MIDHPMQTGAELLLAAVPVGGLLATVTDVTEGLGGYKDLGIAGFAVAGMIVLWRYMREKDAAMLKLIEDGHKAALQAKDDAAKTLADANRLMVAAKDSEVAYLRDQLEEARQGDS